MAVVRACRWNVVGRHFRLLCAEKILERNIGPALLYTRGLYHLAGYTAFLHLNSHGIE